MALKPASLQWSDDGSFESRDYGDVYFQRGQGLEESRYIYLDQNNLPARFTDLTSSISIAELGFGTGLNFLVTADAFLKLSPPDTVLHYTSFEKHPLLYADLIKIYDYWRDELPLTDELLRLQPPLVEGFHTLILAKGRIRLTLIYGDVGDTLPQVKGRFDAWYLDGFAPKTNPDMWAENLLLAIGQRTKPGGTLATFTVVGTVWRGLKAAGFEVAKVDGFGIKWSMIAGKMPGEEIKPSRPKTIAIIGAGIAGCSTARALAERGHRITLIDRQSDYAAEASGNPIGIVYPKMTVDPTPTSGYFMTAFSFALMQLNSLQLRSWKATGVLHKDMDAEGAIRHQDMIARNEYPEEIATHIKDDGLFQLLAGSVNPREWCGRLIDHPHIEKLYKTNIAQLEKTENGWRLWDKNEISVAEVDIVIIASAYDSKNIVQTEWLPLQSLRGQLTFMKPTETSRLLDKVICHDGYIAPAHDKYHVTGASFQKELPAVPDIRAKDNTANLAKLNANLPELQFTADDIAGARTGYRAATPDKLPLIGQLPIYADFIEAFAALRTGGISHNAVAPYYKDLYICTGFGSHGLTAAPLAGEIIGAMIDDTVLPLPERLFNAVMPDRVILRDLKRGKI